MTTEEEIRETFRGPEGKSDGWMWTSYDQYAPNGDVIGSLHFLICPLCGSMVPVPPDEVDVVASPHLDWPNLHIEDHVRRVK